MMRGLRKNAFVLKCGRDSPFESAFFILKASYLPPKCDGDIVAEAEKLVSEVLLEYNPKKPEKSPKKKRLK